MSLGLVMEGALAGEGVKVRKNGSKVWIILWFLSILALTKRAPAAMDSANVCSDIPSKSRLLTRTRHGVFGLAWVSIKPFQYKYVSWI